MRVSILSVAALAVFVFTGCSTSPKGETGKDDLHMATESTVKRLESLDPSLHRMLANSYGYAVFPTVGKGGLIVGGAYGRGEVYEQGNMIGWADISQATIGAQAGGQSFSEIIVFQDKAALDNFKNGKLKLTANVSAVALKSGAADAAKFTDGVIVFIEPKAGLMLEAAVGGQSFSFQPK